MFTDPEYVEPYPVGHFHFRQQVAQPPRSA
jgi:hypothetical protein